MKKNKKINVLSVLLKAALMAVIVIYFACPFSCSFSAEGINLFAIDYETARIENFCAVDSSSISVEFSKNVSFEDMIVYPNIEIKDIVKEIDDKTKMMKAFFLLDGEMQIGKTYSFCGTAVDENGNSLSFSLPVTGYNSRIPSLQITEVHPMYSSGTSKGEKYYKTEYVEFLIRSNGNLSGLCVYGAKDGIEKAFYFPAIEVCEGEVVVAHLRSKGEGCISETGENICLSTAKYSNDRARDLWAQSDDARLGDKEDCVVLKNKNNGKILDCVPYSISQNQSWINNSVFETVKECVSFGVWPSENIKDAVFVDDITASKSIYKKELSSPLENNMSLWAVCERSKETPGEVSFFK